MSIARAYERLHTAVREIVDDGELDLCGHRSVLRRALDSAARLASIGVVGEPDDNAPGLVSGRHGDTSRQAAARIEPRSGTERARVLEAIRGAGGYGQTRDEIADRLGMSPNTVRPRVKELLDSGFVQRTERRRPSNSGRASEVLMATAVRLAA